MIRMKIVELGLDSLDLRYGRLRARRPVLERRLLASFGERGQQSPIVVVPVPGEAGRYVVIDGHAQVRVLERVKADFVRAAVWEMEPVEALMAVYQMKSGGGYSPIEEAWLLHELVREKGWSLAEVGRRLERSKGWCSCRLALVEILPEGVLDGVQKGKIGAYVATKCLVAFARANAEDCEKFAEKISEIGCKSREVEALYRHYNGASRPVKRRIMEDPGRFLKVLEEARKGKQDPELSEAENRCLKNLDLIGGVSLSLTRNLPQAVGYDTCKAARGKLKRAWQRCEERFGMFQKTAEAVFQHREVRRADAAARESMRTPGPRYEASGEVVIHA